MALLTVLLVFISARADAIYRYRLALDWFEPHSVGRPPELNPVDVAATALQVPRELGALALRWALWTGALFAAGCFVGRRRLTWGDALTLTLWGWLPCIVRGLVQLVFMLVTRTPVYNPGLSGLVYDVTPPPLTALRYVQPSPQQWAVALLLRGVDLFAIWQLCLIGWGFAVFTLTPTRKALALAVGIWALALLSNLLIGG